LPDPVVGCECLFAWYWLADMCERERIPFVLGHALAMQSIQYGIRFLRPWTSPFAPEAS
jgi:hypothetical protein